MKLRLVVLVLLVLCVLGWLRLRGLRDEAGTQATEATKEASALPQDASRPTATTNAAVEAAKSAATDTRPVVDKESEVEKNEAAASSDKAASTANVLTNLPLPRFVGGHRANVPPGGALVMGGWPQPNGNRLLLFASPKPSGDGMVLIASRFIAIPPTRLRGGGWERFFTEDSVSKEGGVFTAAEYAEVMARIAELEDVDTLTSPSVTTRYGSQATISIGSEVVVPQGNGTAVLHNGVTQAILARQIEGRDDVDLAVTAAQFVADPAP